MTWISRADALTTTQARFPELSLDAKIVENWTRIANECPVIKKGVRLGYDSDALATWHARLHDSVVQLDAEDYRQCVAFAVEAYYTITRADFSRSKQRDAGEFLTNQIQGKLGEIAVKKLLEKHGLLVKLDFDVVGQVPSQDVNQISTRVGKPVWNNPAVKVSIKATKLKNILLAVTETEATMTDRRSDVYVLSQVGLFPDHLLRIMKQDASADLFKNPKVPDFAGIPARVAGWATYAQLTAKPALNGAEIKAAFGVEMAKPNYVLSSGQLSTDWPALKTLIVGSAA